jgi:hypothetical protein
MNHSEIMLLTISGAFTLANSASSVCLTATDAVREKAREVQVGL